MVARRSLPLGGSQDGLPSVTATQINPTTGQATGVAFAGLSLNSIYNIAGGATILTDHPDFFGRVILAGMHQADGDTIVGYDLDAIVDYDASWLSERPAEGTVAPGATQVVAVTFDATLQAIDQPGEYATKLLLANDTIYGMLATPVQLTVWAPPTWGKIRALSPVWACATSPGRRSSMLT